MKIKKAFDICKKNKNISIFCTEEGLMFIDRTYLNPFADTPNETMVLTLRKDIKGTPYFAVKFGMIAYGFICAYEIVDDKFVKKLRSLYFESEIILKKQEGICR